MNFPSNSPNVAVRYPAGVWTGQPFGYAVTSVVGSLDLTTITSAVLIVIPDAGGPSVTWDCTLGAATATSLALTHHFGPLDTPPGIFRIHGVLTDNTGLLWPCSEISLILYPY